MSQFVCYIPSYNDSEMVGESLASIPEWEVVISDNASSEPHRSLLAGMAGPRVQVIRQEESLGRVGNWKFCVNHFIGSGRQWMKFLCAGDRHTPGSLDVFRRGLERYPAVKYIIPRIFNVYPQQRLLWSMAPDYTLAPPATTMRAAALAGNVFHGLIAPLFHVDVVADGFQFGEETLSFSADMLFLMNIARKTDTLFVPEPAAEFIIARRKNLLAKISTLEHFMEEGLLRLRAADAFGQITGDVRQRNELVAQVVGWLRMGLGQSIEKLSGEFRLTAEQLCPSQSS